MHNRRKYALLLIMALLLGGCWDGRELEKRAMVLMIGLDRSEAGVRLSLQVARPQSLSGAATEGSSGGGDVVTVVTREGSDVSAALHALQLAVDRDLFFGHTRVVLIGEELAREGVTELLQPLYGGASLLPRSAWLFVVHGSAEEVLGLRPSLDRIPATYLTNFFDNRLLLQRPYDVTLGAFRRRLVTPGEEPVVVWVSPGQPDQSAPTLLGLAAFRADRFIGGLGENESKGWLLTQNQAPPGRLPIDCPGRSGRFAVRVISSENRIRPIAQGDSLKGLRALISVRARVEGIDCEANLEEPQEVSRFEQALRQRLGELATASIQMAQQELQSDVFGFGRATYRFAPRAWPGDERWNRLFPELPVEVAVQVVLDDTESYRETVR